MRLYPKPASSYAPNSNRVQVPYAPIFDGRLLLGMSLFSRKYSISTFLMAIFHSINKRWVQTMPVMHKFFSGKKIFSLPTNTQKSQNVIWNDNIFLSRLTHGGRYSGLGLPSAAKDSCPKVSSKEYHYQFMDFVYCAFVIRGLMQKILQTQSNGF